MAIYHVEQVVPYAVNFGLVACILAILLRKPTRKFVYQRHEQMKDSIEAATRAYELASKKHTEAAAKASQLSTLSANLLKSELAQANQEASDLSRKAELESKRLAAETERLAQVEAEDAFRKVRAGFVDLVIEGAENNLKVGLKRDDHAAILKRAQSSIEVGV